MGWPGKGCERGKAMYVPNEHEKWAHVCALAQNIRTPAQAVVCNGLHRTAYDPYNTVSQGNAQNTIVAPIRATKPSSLKSTHALPSHTHLSSLTHAPGTDPRHTGSTSAARPSLAARRPWRRGVEASTCLRTVLCHSCFTHHFLPRPPRTTTPTLAATQYLPAHSYSLLCKSSHADRI